MLNRFRDFWTQVISPVARLFLRLGISPDAVTLVGTIGVAFGALWFFPRGQLLVGVLVITAFVFSDLVDGHMARLSGSSSKWGAFLDSTLDRLGDAAIFGGLVLYFVGPRRLPGAGGARAVLPGDGRRSPPTPGPGPSRWAWRRRAGSPSGPTGWSRSW